MGFVERKYVFVVSNQLTLNMGCSATDTSNIELRNLDFGKQSHITFQWASTKDAGQAMGMRRLFCVFVIHIQFVRFSRIETNTIINTIIAVRSLRYSTM